LRKLGVSFDEKIRPLLNAEQQHKFEAMREQMRKKMIEKMTAEAAGKVEQDLDELKRELERAWSGR